MKHVVALQSVNYGEKSHERGTKFAVVDVPKDDLDVTPTLAADWERWGWVKPVPGKGAAAGEGG